MLVTLYAVSTVGKKLLQWFHNILTILGDNFILYRDLLYACKKTISELVFFGVFD